MTLRSHRGVGLKIQDMILLFLENKCPLIKLTIRGFGSAIKVLIIAACCDTGFIYSLSIIHCIKVIIERVVYKSDIPFKIQLVFELEFLLVKC